MKDIAMVFLGTTYWKCIKCNKLVDEEDNYCKNCEGKLNQNEYY